MTRVTDTTAQMIKIETTTTTKMETIIKETVTHTMVEGQMTELIITQKI